VYLYLRQLCTMLSVPLNRACSLVRRPMSCLPYQSMSFLFLWVLPSYCFTSLCILNYWCQTTGQEEHFPSWRISCSFVLQEIFGILGHMSLWWLSPNMQISKHTRHFHTWTGWGLEGSCKGCAREGGSVFLPNLALWKDITIRYFFSLHWAVIRK
jgi:hypothetical protein